MKLVFIVKYFYPIKRPSGISAFLYDLATEVAKKHEVHVVSFDYHRQRKTSDHNGFKIHKVKKPFGFNAARATNKLHPDKVIVFSGVYKTWMLLPCFWVMSVILRKRNFFCQCTNFSKNILETSAGIALRRFEKFIGLNTAISQIIGDVDPDETYTFFPGVNTQRLAEVKAAQASERVRIGFFGHLTHRKGADRLVDAYLKLPAEVRSASELLIVGGEGDALKSYEKKLKKSTDIIVKEGYQEDALNLMASCDIACLPYRTGASVLGIAQSAIEAMYFKVPVIGSENESLSDLVGHGKDGMIFMEEFELPNMLADLIANKKLREEMGQRARQKIENEFTIQKSAESFLKIIEKE